MQGFTDAKGKTYLPGDVVELPASYEGEKWLEHDSELDWIHRNKVEVPISKVELAPETVPAAPLPEKKSKKTK